MLLYYDSFMSMISDSVGLPTFCSRTFSLLQCFATENRISLLILHVFRFRSTTFIFITFTYIFIHEKLKPCVLYQHMLKYSDNGILNLYSGVTLDAAIMLSDVRCTA